jgi:predicted ester cyclase
MQITDANKRVVQESIERTWRRGDLDALPSYWTETCVNHSASVEQRQGLAALREYHAQFAAFFAAFTDMTIVVEQQIAEGDRVVTYMKTSLRHTGPFAGIAATGKTVTLASMRIDRIENDKIAEHWSVGDMAGLLEQLKS